MSGAASIRFQEEERQELEQLQEAHNLSLGAAVRIVVRAYFGLAVPSWAAQVLSEETESRRIGW